MIQWRKAWEADWPSVKYCSKGCRSRRADVSREGAKLEIAILHQLDQRPKGATLCPSDVARALEPEEEAWRALMGPVREAARRLVARGELQITQGGQVVDPSTAKGAIRLRRVIARAAAERPSAKTRR